ncbi:hypothetical protein J3459_018426 [Metarhizium acridum]|nr:hypothetical protein J3459_018426 [Metarhizium acridum]
MWGALLMLQAVVHNFGSLLVLRVLSGAFEAIADPASMLITSMYYTRAEQPSRISAWYAWNGIGVAGGGLLGTMLCNRPHQRGPSILAPRIRHHWRPLRLLGHCPLSHVAQLPAHIRGFSHDEKLTMIARIRRNQTGIEQRRVSWAQIKEAYLYCKTWLFTLLGFVANIPNGGISNFQRL